MQNSDLDRYPLATRAKRIHGESFTSKEALAMSRYSKSPFLKQTYRELFALECEERMLQNNYYLIVSGGMTRDFYKGVELCQN